MENLLDVLLPGMRGVWLIGRQNEGAAHLQSGIVAARNYRRSLMRYSPAGFMVAQVGKPAAVKRCTGNRRSHGFFACGDVTRRAAMSTCCITRIPVAAGGNGPQP